MPWKKQQANIFQRRNPRNAFDSPELNARGANQHLGVSRNISAGKMAADK